MKNGLIGLATASLLAFTAPLAMAEQAAEAPVINPDAEWPVWELTEACELKMLPFGEQIPAERIAEQSLLVQKCNGDNNLFDNTEALSDILEPLVSSGIIDVSTAIDVFHATGLDHFEISNIVWVQAAMREERAADYLPDVSDLMEVSTDITFPAEPTGPCYEDSESDACFEHMGNLADYSELRTAQGTQQKIAHMETFMGVEIAYGCVWFPNELEAVKAAMPTGWQASVPVFFETSGIDPWVTACPDKS